MKSNDFTSRNLFKFIFFLTFIDVLLFSIHRLLIKFQLTDESFFQFYNSDFSLANYFIFILYSFGAFFLTIILSIKVPVNKFKIYMSKNFFFLFINDFTYIFYLSFF